MTVDDAGLEPLVTECPHCGTRFRVTEQQLQLAAGRVRCGACLTVFQGVERLVWDEPSEFESEEEAQHALDALLEELEPDDDGREAAATADVPVAGSADDLPSWIGAEHQLYGGHEEDAESGPTGIVLDEHHWPGARARADEAELEQQPSTAKLDAPLAPAEPAPEPITETPTQPSVEAATQGPAKSAPESGDVPATSPLAPEELATTPGPSAAALAQRLAREVEPAGELQFGVGDAPKRRWWVPVAIVFALLALVAQVLWYQFDRWTLDLRVRPLYAAICSALDCELPVLRDVDAMVAKNLVVRSHPEVAGALLVNAVIVNQAPFAQPFPNLELRFTTLNGTLVAGREFTPGEYLAGELRGAVELARNVPVHVELAIEDPGADAVNYYLSFR